MISLELRNLLVDGDQQIPHFCCNCL